jgi:hypothetical protein
MLSRKMHVQILQAITRPGEKPALTHRKAKDSPSKKLACADACVPIIKDMIAANTARKPSDKPMGRGMRRR